jgi:hypothetical protein
MRKQVSFTTSFSEGILKGILRLALACERCDWIHLCRYFDGNINVSVRCEACERDMDLGVVLRGSFLFPCCELDLVPFIIDRLDEPKLIFEKGEKMVAVDGTNVMGLLLVIENFTSVDGELVKAMELFVQAMMETDFDFALEKRNLDELRCANDPRVEAAEKIFDSLCRTRAKKFLENSIRSGSWIKSRYIVEACYWAALDRSVGWFGDENVDRDVVLRQRTHDHLVVEVVKDEQDEQDAMEIEYPTKPNRTKVQKFRIGRLVGKVGNITFEPFSTFCLHSVARAESVFFFKLKNCDRSIDDCDVVLTMEQLQSSRLTVNALLLQNGQNCMFQHRQIETWQGYVQNVLADDVEKWKYYPKIGMITATNFAWSNKIQFQRVNGQWVETSAFKSHVAVLELMDFDVQKLCRLPVKEAQKQLLMLHDHFQQSHVFFWLITYIVASLACDCHELTPFFHLWIHGPSNAGKSVMIQAALSTIIPSNLMTTCPFYKEHATQEEAETCLKHLNGTILVLDELDKMKKLDLGMHLKTWANTFHAGLILCFNEDSRPNSVLGLRRRFIEMEHAACSSVEISFSSTSRRLCEGLWCLTPLMLQISEDRSLTETEIKFQKSVPQVFYQPGLILLHFGLLVGTRLLNLSEEQVLDRFKSLCEQNKDNKDSKELFCSILKRAVEEKAANRYKDSVRFLRDQLIAWGRSVDIKNVEVLLRECNDLLDVYRVQSERPTIGKQRCDSIKWSVIQQFAPDENLNE